MTKAKKATPKKKTTVKKKTTKPKPLKLGKGGGKGGILPLSGKPVKKAAPKKKAVVKKKVVIKKKSIKLGGRGTNSGGGQ